MLVVGKILDNYYLVCSSDTKLKVVELSDTEAEKHYYSSKCEFRVMYTTRRLTGKKMPFWCLKSINRFITNDFKVIEYYYIDTNTGLYKFKELSDDLIKNEVVEYMCIPFFTKYLYKSFMSKFKNLKKVYINSLVIDVDNDVFDNNKCLELIEAPRHLEEKLKKYSAVLKLY